MVGVLGVDFGSAGAHPEVYDAIQAGGRRFVIRYLSSGPKHHTREEAEWAAERGILSGHVWQNDHSEEVWQGRDGAKPGYETGRICAELARDQQREIAGCARPIISALDKANTSENGRWPISVGIDFLRGWKSVVGKDRMGVYGSGMTIRALQRFNDPPVRFYWLSWLLDGIYVDPPRKGTRLQDLPGKVHILQYGNADQDPNLSHFGMEGEWHSYVGHDRASGELGDLLWLPK